MKDFFFHCVIGMYAFLESRRKESLKLNVLLNRPFLTLIKEEDLEGSVFHFFMVLLHKLVFAKLVFLTPSRRAKMKLKFLVYWKRIFGICCL